MDSVYDICVVGAGLIGAAAARHASARPGVRVCLIGPDEPEERVIGDARDIYGSHYDEGRITRGCSTSHVWGKLAVESIKRYRDLEKQSGIKFYSEVGGLMVGTKDLAKSVEQKAVKNNVNVKTMTPEDLRASFPYLKFSSDTRGVYEPKDAGYISPRKMLAAHKSIAATQGCVIIKEIVSNVWRRSDDAGNYAMSVETDTGRTISCRSVLVATGAFTSFRNLLPGVSLDVTPIPLAVALVEITKDVAQRLRGMPSIIFEGDRHPDWITDTRWIGPGNVGFYMLPPVRYPNGKYYIKLGVYHDSTRHISINTSSDAKRWFVNGDHSLAEATHRLLLSILKDVPVESWRSDFCLIVETPSYLPYIDKVHAQLGVATGGCGHAAKSSDEIGRLAADMMFSEWNSDIPRETFQIQYKKGQKSNL